MPEVPSIKQDFVGKREKVGRIRLTSNPTSAINPQPHVHDLLWPDQPLYLVNTGASASILGINMLSDAEKRSMQDPAVDPVQVLALNGDNIKVFSKIYHTVSIDNKLHRHQFLITALPRPLLGWDFLRTHHAVIKATPEEVKFHCKCPDSGGPMEKLERYTPVSRPMRRCQHKRKSVLSASSSLYKTRSTGLVHSNFSDP